MDDQWFDRKWGRKIQHARSTCIDTHTHLRIQTIRRSLEKVDCLSAAGRDNRWTVMRINSRSVEIVNRPIFQRSLRGKISRISKLLRVRLFPSMIDSAPIISSVEKRCKKESANIPGQHQPFSLEQFPRSTGPFFSSFSQEFFNIRYTSLGMFPRIDIPFRRAESSDHGDAAQITEPSEQEGWGGWKGGRKKRKKNKGAGPRTRWKMWRDRRLPLSSPLPAQSRRYMNCHGRTLNASHPPRGNLFGHRNDGTYGTPSIETGPCAFQRY